MELGGLFGEGLKCLSGDRETTERLFGVSVPSSWVCVHSRHCYGGRFLYRSPAGCACENIRLELDIGEPMAASNH